MSPRVVIHVEGDNASAVARRMTKALPGDLAAADEQAFLDALSLLGASSTLGARINDAGARGNLVDLVMRATQGTWIKAVILARVLSSGRDQSLWVLAIDTTSGRLLVDSEVGMPIKTVHSGKRGRRREETVTNYDQVIGTLNVVYSNVNRSGNTSSSWSSVTAAPGQAGTPTPIADEEKTDADTSRTGGRIRSDKLMLSIRPSYSFAGRRLAYSGYQGPSAPDYRLSGTSMLGIDVEFFPGALTRNTAVKPWSLHLAYGRALGLTSKTEGPNPSDVTTSWDELLAEVKARFGRELTFHPSLGFGMNRFSLSSSSNAAAALADASYSFLRLGAEVQYALKSMRLFGGLGYRYVLGKGSLGKTYYPDASSWGLDAQAGAGISATENLELQVLGRYSRFANSLKAPTDSAQSAKSAADQFYGVLIGLAILL